MLWLLSGAAATSGEELATEAEHRVLYEGWEAVFWDAWLVEAVIPVYAEGFSGHQHLRTGRPLLVTP